MTDGRPHPVRALVHAWLILDFFGDARRSGAAASTLTTTVFSQSFLALIVAALLYPEPPPVPFAAANLSLSTLLVALGAFDTEPPAHRRAADRLLLATSPLSRLPALAARAAHGAFSSMLLTIGLALPPALLLACRQHDALLAPAYVAMACTCSALATGALSVALRLVRRWLGGQQAALVAGTGKALVLAFGVVVFVLSLPALRADADALPIGRIGANLLPPYHAAEWLAAPTAHLDHLLLLLAAAVVLALLALAVGEGERDAAPLVRGEGPMTRLMLRLCSDRASAGIAAFTATMLWRSPGVRARALPLLGMPAAIAFLAWRDADARSRALFTSMALQFPAVYLPFVVSMLRQADQQGSRWSFDTAPPVSLPAVQRAVWLALVFRLLLPVQLAALPVLLLSGLGPGHALSISAFSFAAGAAIARAMAQNVDDIPFCRDEGGDAVDFGNLMAFGIVLAGAAAVVALAPTVHRLAATAAAIATLGWLLVPPRRAVGDASRSPTAGSQSVSTQAGPASGGDASPKRAADAAVRAKSPPASTQSLRRELWAIGTLYAIQSVLPLAIGLLVAN